MEKKKKKKWDVVWEEDRARLFSSFKLEKWFDVREAKETWVSRGLNFQGFLSEKSDGVSCSKIVYIPRACTRVFPILKLRFERYAKF